MVSRYGIFCTVIETGNFTRAARQLGYSESSVSQSVKALEREMGVTLIDRKKSGLNLTEDGKQFYPYLLSVYNAEKALEQKRLEVEGLENSTIRLGTFTGISRTSLPGLISGFQKEYPSASFELRQGEYTSIAQAVRDGSADLGFVIARAAGGLKTQILYKEEMMAVLPPGSRPGRMSAMTLEQLARAPFILLGEGEQSVALQAFEAAGLQPHIRYTVMDDYTIMAMVRQGMGVSMLYRSVLEGCGRDLTILPIEDPPVRSVCLAWNNSQTLSLAARKFAHYILSHGQDLQLPGRAWN